MITTPYPPDARRGDFAPGSFLRTYAWLDADGEHIWCRHDCTEGQVTHMLPWPTWHWNRDKPSEIVPSYSCDACGVHVFLTFASAEEMFRERLG